MSSKFTPTQEQLDIVKAFKNSSVLKVNAVAGSGKEQPISCSVKTPEGDTILGAIGQPIKVTGVFPQGIKDVYEVVFARGGSSNLS